MPLKYFRSAMGVICAFLLCSVPTLRGQDDKPVVARAAATKFGPAPNAPDCFTISAVRGNPSQAASVLLARFAPGCVAPYPSHTPSETVMIVGGALEFQMRGDKAMLVHRGDFAYMPPKHVHRATCTGSAPCLVYLSAEGPFDVHWVDADDKEITLEAAMKTARV